MRKLLALSVFLLLGFLGFGQDVKSPAEFLGYNLGTRFTPHYQVLDYFRYIASVSKNVRIQQYGQTYEGRPLLLAFIGSDDHIELLEEIRRNNLLLAGLQKETPKKEQPAIVWMSYNVHGNEAVSSEASMLTLFDLVDPKNSLTKKWLQNVVVIIDPCMNPDGRERYVNFYNSVKNLDADPLPFTREHFEPWPGGRTNHYYFDVNRDWAWQTQKETQQRMEIYNKWLPQVHVDFHEQGINSPYYFAPAAEPFHQDISKWQREFQTVIGRNNAKYFDQKGWLYFTKERFDLLYPSYGDTYPTYNGSIGMTFEQGGSGRAGLAVLTREGDTLTLTSRIAHHHTTGLSTIESASVHARNLIDEYEKYFTSSANSPAGQYKTYVIRGGNIEKIKALTSLLNRNGIEYGFGSAKGGRGLNYLNGKIESFKVNAADLVISAFQPKSVLLKVLFEPRTFVSDSVTYDITAWALPYAYGVEAFATKDILKPVSSTSPAIERVASAAGKPVAFAGNWNSLADAKFLAGLLKKDIKVRYSEVPFEAGGKQFNAGSLLITRKGNEELGDNFEGMISRIAKMSGVSLQPIASGFLDKGPDLGSEKIRFIVRPKVAVLAGENVSPQKMGEVWHFFEQQLGYPISVISPEVAEQENINDFNVIVLPDGNYTPAVYDKLLVWVTNGGRLIAMEGAVSGLVGKRGVLLKAREESDKEKKDMESITDDLKPYGNRERELARLNIPGAIFRVDLDNTHPLAFGFPSYYYTLKLDDKIYAFLNGGWNVGVFKKDSYITGFAGAETRKKLVDGLLFGVQDFGNGSIVYLADDPLFRSFWENGKLLFSNAIFMVGQ